MFDRKQHNLVLKDFLKRMAQGTLKDGEVIDFSVKNSHNRRIKSDQAILIAEQLKHPNCPANITIKLNNNDIGKKGVDAIKKAIASGKCQPGLKLELEKSGMKRPDRQAIQKMISLNKKMVEENEAARACLQVLVGKKFGDEAETAVTKLSRDAMQHIFSFVYPDQTEKDNQGVYEKVNFANRILATQFTAGADRAVHEEDSEGEGEVIAGGDAFSDTVTEQRQGVLCR